MNKQSSGWELYRGVKNMLRCDEAEVVHSIVDYIVSQYRSLRFFSNLIERTRSTPLPGFFGVLGWARCFLSVRPGECNDGAVWIARLSNERRAIEAMLPFAQDLNWTEMKFRDRPATTAWRALTKHRSPMRIFKLVRRLKRYEFFKVLRVIEFLGYYTRYLEIFQNSRFNLAVMSTHSNPHGLAFNLAARKCDVPVVLITHGMPIRPVARLSYDLAVVHCEFARRVYNEEGSRMEHVFTHGRLQNYVPMPSQLPERLTVGIFLCKDVNEKRLQTLVTQLLSDANVSSIRIRPHPKNLWLGLKDWIEAQQDPRLRITANGSVFQDVKSVDIVLGGNSSVLIDAVTAGRPSGYVTDLDHGPYDLHRFVEYGLIYPIRDNWTRESMLSFYERPDWLNVLRLFANIDENEETVAVRMVSNMRQLVMKHGSNHS